MGNHARYVNGELIEMVGQVSTPDWVDRLSRGERGAGLRTGRYRALPRFEIYKSSGRLLCRDIKTLGFSNLHGV